MNDADRISRIMKNMGGSTDDVSDWMDDLGCCKICGGEIPGGHQHDSYIYAQEKEVKRLKQEIEWQELKEKLHVRLIASANDELAKRGNKINELEEEILVVKDPNGRYLR
jgi:DNA repair exonuclease SbcCD ATPase subunit